MRKAINTSQLTIRQSSLSPPLAHATRNYVCTSPDAPESGSESRLESAPESRSNFGSGSESGSVSEFATIFPRPQTPRCRSESRSKSGCDSGSKSGLQSGSELATISPRTPMHGVRFQIRVDVPVQVRVQVGVRMRLRIQVWRVGVLHYVCSSPDARPSSPSPPLARVRRRRQQRDVYIDETLKGKSL